MAKKKYESLLEDVMNKTAKHDSTYKEYKSKIQKQGGVVATPREWYSRVEKVYKGSPKKAKKSKKLKRAKKKASGTSLLIRYAKGRK